MQRRVYRLGRVTMAAVTATVGVALLIPPAAQAPERSLMAQLNAEVPLSVTGDGRIPDPPKVDAKGRPIAFYTYVANIGDQSDVDACAGGLTYFIEVAEYLRKPYYPIHNYCGGQPILSLHPGDLVMIRQLGEFKVVSGINVLPGDTARSLAGLAGDIYLQTCYDDQQTMRVVGLDRI